MKKFFAQYIFDRNAATAIEYSLMASGVALAIVAIVFLLGDELLALYNDVLAIF